MHWADQIAEELKERGGHHVIASGTSISGVPHIGNASDVIRGDFVRHALSDAGVSAKLIWVADDGDPFRKAPTGMEALAKYIGHPVHDIPDPNGCHRNFVDHFAKPFLEDLESYGVEPEYYSSRELYTSGAFVEEIRTALKNGGKIREILDEFRTEALPKDYIPWNALCKKCGRISTTNATSVDGDKVRYVCGSAEVSGKEVLGCGFAGESDITKGEGKLPWRVEWAARWHHFKVTCEPFGKEHATRGGSYDTSKRISEDAYGWPAPYPVVYEFFTLDGEKISSSKGNVITLADWRKIAEPQVLKYFMAKRIGKQRDIDLAQLPQLTDEYDSLAAKHAEGVRDEETRNYELAQFGGSGHKVGVPYTLCAVLSQIIQSPSGLIALDLYQKRVEAMGYHPDPNQLHNRVNKAGEWVHTEYCPDNLKFDLRRDNTSNLSEKQRHFLLNISRELDNKWTPESLHKRIYELSRESELEPSEAFKAIYLTLIGKEKGPKAAMFLLSLEKDFVQKRFNGV